MPALAFVTFFPAFCCINRNENPRNKSYQENKTYEFSSGHSHLYHVYLTRQTHVNGKSFWRSHHRKALAILLRFNTTNPVSPEVM